MKNFSKLRDVGRGRLLYTSTSSGRQERLYLASTNEFVLCTGDEELILSSQKKAISWATKKKLCSDKEEFLQRCVDVVRIPYRARMPKIRLGNEDERHAQMNPHQRIEELLQHPLYNRCLISHCNGNEDVVLTRAQRDEVVDIVNTQFETDYYGGAKVRLSERTFFMYENNEQNVQMFSVWMDGWYYLECFSVFSGFNLPFDFTDQFDYINIDETTWLRAVGNQQIVDKGTMTKLALIAISVSLHYQLNYENLYKAPDEYPFTTLQGLGILPYESSPDLYY